MIDRSIETRQARQRSRVPESCTDRGRFRQEIERTMDDMLVTRRRCDRGLHTTRVREGAESRDFECAETANVQ
jgi:hypothetical protein